MPALTDTTLAQRLAILTSKGSLTLTQLSIEVGKVDDLLRRVSIAFQYATLDLSNQTIILSMTPEALSLMPPRKA